MHRSTSTVAAAACATCLLAPVTAYSEIPEYPDTPLVTVSEIGPNWVEIKALIHYDSVESAFDGEFSPNGFIPDNPDHMHQVYELGDYVCKLNDRRGVVLSQTTEEEDAGVSKIVSSIYYLVACALP